MNEVGDGLSARFKGTLGGFSLDVELTAPGRSVTALVGPSGAGKTLLLRCIAGLERLPGRLVVGGELWRDEKVFLAPHRRAVGYVFQEASLLPHLSVRGNLEYARRRAPSAGRLDEVVASLGLERLLERAPERLSGGERQRVALGRALLTAPRLLLLDEPLAGLDAEAKAEILPYLEALHESLEIPALYVSHDPLEVARIADQILTLRAGRIESPTPVPLDQAGAAALVKAMDREQLERLGLAALAAGITPPPSA